MAFKGIQSKPDPITPPLARVTARSFPPPPPSADFSDIYEPDPPPNNVNGGAPLSGSKNNSPPPAAVPSQALNPKLERLIEIVCEHMGSPPEEIRALKANALISPDPIHDYCSGYYDREIRPKREQLDSLAEAILERPDCFCFKYILPSGESAVLCVNRALRPELALYHNQTLTHYEDDNHPFGEDPEDNPSARLY